MLIDLKTIIVLLFLFACGCGSLPPENISGKDKIFNLNRPNKEALKNASSDFISNITANKDKMSDCAEKFLLTDNYQDWIYRKYIRSRSNADKLYFLYKNELALSLSRSEETGYQQLLLKYYYPDGTRDMTSGDMMSAAVKRLTCHFKDFYGKGGKTKEAEIDFKSKDELSDGRILSVYSIKWQDMKEASIYNTIFMKKNISGSEVLIPVQHSIIGKEEE
ncbi:MAG TPA: hypothetical protein DCZ94_07915 [Lentisphaeria bacterium]|nr:MAG: hypothetical protein A2X48_24315 [Lentisphaerae bacterium GWF2_49_21]HBC86863.1 hypothetical protein [Lentisphaeria bacterium]